MSDGPGVKIRFPNEQGEIETMWARDLGDGRYQIDNMPWFTYGISLGDVVATDAEGDGGLRFRAVLEKSGNRTLRVLLTESSGTLSFESQGLLPTLEALGCAWEGATSQLIAVNVPPGVELDTVTAALEATDVRWEYADPTPEAMGIGAIGEST